MEEEKFKGYRDAIHVPFVMVTCDEALRPGDKCSLRDDWECVKWYDLQGEPMWHGVADPWRESDIPKGELFAVYIRKECFSRLRHDFTIDVYDRGGTETCHSVCNIF